VFGIGTCRLDIHDSGDELWGVVCSMVLGLRLQTAEDTIVAAVEKHAGHVFERRVHVGRLSEFDSFFQFRFGNAQRLLHPMGTVLRQDDLLSFSCASDNHGL
jgi:hypothetical protein